MDIQMSLSLEQKFSLRTYEESVKSLDHQQAQEMLLEVLRQLMLKDNVIKNMIKGNLLPFN
jgi:Phycobilisome degradation protein nblA